MEETLQPGKYVIVQRQKYTKLHKLKEHSIVRLGKDTIEMDNVLGHRYFETFKMELKPRNKIYTLEKIDNLVTSTKITFEESGKDNRNIVDDSCSQALSKEEIEKLRDQNLGSHDIVEKLITNSKSFKNKTEYSQEKYIKKKERKYFEYIQVRKTTIRLLAEILFRQEPSKILGIRIDDLSQILIYGNIQSDGNVLLYDSGSSGLVSASIMNAIGANTTGKLIHTHPGNECQKSAFLSMNFPQEQSDRCINVNIYSVLRCYYQGDIRNENIEINETCAFSNKRQREPDDDSPTCSSQKRPFWQIDNSRACDILRGKVDSLIIVTKEHPQNIIEELATFLKPSRALVVFSTIVGVLEELYFYLKKRRDFISIRLTNNFLRNYQVLPERTHPELTMSYGGYLLTAYKIKL